MVVTGDLHESIRALINRKLGRCPRCMASSIVGSGLSWLALAILYTMWPNRLAVMFGLTVALAFTVLMIAHVVVHMFRAAPVVRNHSASRGRAQESRREFALAVARSGLSFAAAALMTLPLLSSRAEAGPNRTYALYCLGEGCSTQGNGKGLPVTCLYLGHAAGTRVSVECGRTAPKTMTCQRAGCTLTLELVDSTCAAATAPIVSLKGYKCM